MLADEPNEELKPKVTISPHRVQSDIDSLFEQFSSVFSDNPGNTEIVKMTIEANSGKVLSQAPYKIPERLKDGVWEQIDRFLDLDIIEESLSPWCSPIVPVLKPTGEVRLCVDYRRLNLHTHQQH